MVTTTDIAEFRHYLDETLRNLESKLVLCQLTSGMLSRDYMTQYGKHQFSIYMPVNREYYTTVTFKYYFNAAQCLMATLDVSNLFFHAEKGGSKWYSQLLEQGQESLWYSLGDSVKQHLMSHVDTFKEGLAKTWIAPEVVYNREDVIYVLEKTFDKYASFHNHTTQGQNKVINTKHKNLLLQLRYAEKDSWHDHINLYVVYQVDGFEKMLYQCSYFFAKNSFVQSGEVPDGFDEGFKKFKLLGSLVT